MFDIRNYKKKTCDDSHIKGFKMLCLGVMEVVCCGRDN